MTPFFFTWSGSGRSFSCPTAMQMSARAANTPHPLVSSFIRYLLRSAPERMGEASFLASLSADDLAAGERLLLCSGRPLLKALALSSRLPLLRHHASPRT